MALKKSELYSSLWASCDELRGGMDASQYKDYVLVLLFVKYVSDRYAGEPYAPISIPQGASFADMVALKGKSDIGDQINKKILGPLAQANKLSDMPDFNDPNKLGSGKEMVERLTNLIAIFENPALDFSKNRADGDDLLGDAYEYLMRHFATESGKSKGQFYTPAEVSRVIAQWRPAAQTGRLRLPLTHFAIAQEHRQRRMHPSARRAVSWWCGGGHPPQPRPTWLPERHNRPAAEPLLRHQHSRLHRRARQGKARTPVGVSF
jgi:N-6 DNA Methylase/HsdM N-terminal domain